MFGGGLGEGLVEGANEIGVGGFKSVLLSARGGLGVVSLRRNGVVHIVWECTCEECSTWKDVWLSVSK